MAGNINRVIITGNLTRDPELRAIPGGDTSVCSLRVAVNGRRRNASGGWEDQPNFFDVTVWGQQGENCHKYLKKGRPVAVDGRLRWREWEKEGQKRQAVDIIAESVQFLGSREGAGNGNGYSSSAQSSESYAPVQSTESDVPIDSSDFETAPVGGEATSAGGQMAPPGGETAPVGGQMAPAGGETAPVSGESTPVRGTDDIPF
jgi:single-strand DNA-binding protein